MFLTSLVILVAVGATFRPLRNSFYALHAAVVVAASWAMEQRLGAEPVALFSPEAIETFVILHLISINVVTFLAYAYDKYVSGTYRRRVPEKTLLMFAFIGGTPAAIIASKLLRHKTNKKSFIQRFWVVMFFQFVAIVALLQFV